MGFSLGSNTEISVIDLGSRSELALGVGGFVEEHQSLVAGRADQRDGPTRKQRQQLMFAMSTRTNRSKSTSTRRS